VTSSRSRSTAGRSGARVDLVGLAGSPCSEQEALAALATREVDPRLARHDDLPADTRLWAALQAVSGGVWAGCVYDPERIEQLLTAGLRAEQDDRAAAAPSTTP
jgi:hypothetical protein